MPNNRNLHRDVFFKDCAKVPQMPYTSLDSNHPEHLWNWMDTQRKAGNELLAISHNANVSDGWMYPIDVDTYQLATLDLIRIGRSQVSIALHKTKALRHLPISDE